MTNNQPSKLSVDKEKIEKAEHDELIDMATEMFARFYWEYWHCINKKGEYKNNNNYQAYEKSCNLFQSVHR